MYEVLLALYVGGGKIGAAYYEEDIKTVRILQDIAEEGDFSVVASLLSQVNPTQVLVCSSQDVALLAFLNQICVSEEESTASSTQPPPDEASEDFEEPVIEDISCSAIEREDEGLRFTASRSETLVGDVMEVSEFSREPPAQEEASKENSAEDDEFEDPNMRLILLPKTEFRFEYAQKRIQLLFMEESNSFAENKLITSFRVDMSCGNMVRAFGALLKYMDRNRIGVEYESVEVKTPVSSIKVFTVEQMLDIDQTTYKALQIFQSDYHPSAGRSLSACRSSTKEGLSLFRICNRCRSIPGKKLLRRWFERPTTNRSILLMRQKAISYFIQDCNMEVTQFLYTKLKHVKSLRGILARIRGGTVSVNDWKNLYMTCCNMVKVSEFLKGRKVKLEILEDLLPFCNQELISITAVLAQIIDFEASAKEDRFVVAHGVDKGLDKLKEIHDHLPEMLTEVAKKECRDLDISTCSVGYIPVIGFLLTIPVDVEVSQEGLESLEMVFNTEEAANYKSERMRKLDTKIGDIQPMIMDMERSIMLRIQANINDRSAALLRALHVMAVIEALISLTIAAREFNWNRPHLVDEPVINVEGSRHPISELMSEKPFVSNPIKSGGDSSKVKLLTGPNASGKSVYLKQVGIIAYLAHIGSFVPADKAVIGPINRILTRMYTIDKVLDGMSTFAKDLNQISVALRRSNGFSLVIIDEFGKGTMTEVGLSILACTLNFWLEKGKEACPHIYVSSHFHSLSELLEPPEGMLTYNTLQVRKRGEKLEFLHKLMDGMIDCSYASYTAAQVGMDRELVKRADQIYELLKQGKTLDSIPPSNFDDHEASMIAARQMETLLPDFMSWDLENDPKGFLEVAMSVLNVYDEMDDDVPLAPPEGAEIMDAEAMEADPLTPLAPLDWNVSEESSRNKTKNTYKSVSFREPPSREPVFKQPRTEFSRSVFSEVTEIFGTQHPFQQSQASSIGSPNYVADFCFTTQRTTQGTQQRSTQQSTQKHKDSNGNFADEIVPETQISVVPETQMSQLHSAPPSITLDRSSLTPGTQRSRLTPSAFSVKIRRLN
ncbi:hypothetical protein L596_017937 [Steinernema carpocapsae]|uniref:DNA mismatch repair proteins mutS family domain-containing protein n=1 Tax=Steinernema carpocapsae TaxID=34508 RepID=A0A4U5N3Y5_STECR|nr:hypothetical protein L596_017937 [Steinernema carpocapsae]